MQHTYSTMPVKKLLAAANSRDRLNIIYEYFTVSKLRIQNKNLKRGVKQNDELNENLSNILYFNEQ